MTIRKVFQEKGLNSGTRRELKDAIGSTQVGSGIGQLILMIRAEHVGIDMMEITVCGALAPYNLILGGKLVCMMLGSPEVVRHYGQRYGDQISIIASSMKGKPVRRKPQLVLLSTTSLYGGGLSQYSRVKIPAEEVGGEVGEKFEYKKLGLSDGVGVYHFSSETLRLIDTVIARRQLGRSVNWIFGEGVNPLMRKIRQGLEAVGFASDLVLNHGNPRIIYGVALAKNFREILLGLEKRPKYIIPQTNPQDGSEMIADYWRRRWLSSRINKPGILEQVAQHTLTYPVFHGALVPKPSTKNGPGTIQTLWD